MYIQSIWVGRTGNHNCPEPKPRFFIELELIGLFLMTLKSITKTNKNFVFLF